MENKKAKLNLIPMSEIAVQPVNWLWYPYIPFGKLTIIQGDPGEGKTTLALQIASDCSAGRIPGQEAFPVIYQTAEDGLGDTIKPRLLAAKADEQKIFCIDESHDFLTLMDSRLEEAIVKTGARLLILDPVQGYLKDGTDMNRANEVRKHMKSLASVAERTSCAIILVGHLNKAQGTSSSYRGLGSIDFRAAARSVLLVGRHRSNRNIRVIVHDKSSLAPEGASKAFSLGTEEGFYWVAGYEDVTADGLLGGIVSDNKTDAAEQLICGMLSSGEMIPCEDIFAAAQEKDISRRTVNEAKKNLGNIRSVRQGKGWAWIMDS